MNRQVKKNTADSKVERRASKTTNLAALAKKVNLDPFNERNSLDTGTVRRYSARRHLSFSSLTSFDQIHDDDASSVQTTTQGVLSTPSLSRMSSVVGKNDVDGRILGNEMKYDKSKYFGELARDRFFDRYKWMARMKDDLTDDCDLMENTMFDSSITKVMDFPFSVRRPDIDDHHDEFEDYDLDADAEGGEGSIAVDGERSSGFNYTIQHGEDAFSASNGQSARKENREQTYSSVLKDSQATSLAAISGPFSQFTSITPTSPRSRYIVGCIREQLNPRASLILRRRLNSELKLEHLGMGDRMGIVFADALRDMSYVHSINLDDNNLTDVSMGAIIASVSVMPNITYLNLSRNVVDGNAAMALATFLRTTECPLKRLICQKSDIDDFECHLFVAALECNTTLEELDLGSNVIGRAENLNTVMPELITGGEALAALIASNTCHITMLHLSWNMIRLDGAVELASSLEHNKYLRYLDLSFNSLSVEGGEMLGMALISNQSLRTLLLSNNNINSSACFTICVGIEENFSLEYVNLDSNPIGQAGAKMLMQIPVTSGSRVTLSANKCNITLKTDKDELFHMDNIPGKYHLDLANHYQRAICVKLLHLVATSKTLVVKEMLYTSPIPHGSKMKEPKQEKIELVESILKTKEILDLKKQRVVDNLYKIQQAAEDIQTAQALFNQFDTDFSGGLDLDELQSLLKSIEMDVDEAVLREALANYDIDGSCIIGLPEFLDFLRGQKEEAVARIKELTEHAVMAKVSAPDQRYVPPKEGIMYVEVVDGYMRKNKVKVISGMDHSHVKFMTKDEPDNKVDMIAYSLINAKLRIREAWDMYQIIFEELRDKVKSVEKLLPHMYDAKDARMLLFKALEDDKVELARVKKIFRYALRPILGMPDGYYVLDLTNEKDRLCMSLLIEQSEYQKTQRIEQSMDGLGESGDLSQRGDWSSFRNAFLNDMSIALTKEMFTPMPKSGKVSFDFSGADKPPKNALVMTDSRCMNVLFITGLVDRVEKIQGLKALRKMELECGEILMGDEPYRSVNNRKRANAIRACTNKFYTRLDLREKQLKRSVKHEGVKIDFGKQTSTATDGGDDNEGDGKYADGLMDLFDVADLSDTDSSHGSMNSLGDVAAVHSDGSASEDSDDSDNEDGKEDQAKEVGDNAEEVSSASAGVKRRPVLARDTMIKSLAPSATLKKGGRPPATANAGQSGRMQFIPQTGIEANVVQARPFERRRNSINLPKKNQPSSTAQTELESSNPPENPKILKNMKSSFGIDDATGRVTRKIGAILPTHSEKYILDFGNKFRQIAETAGINDSAKSVRIVSALEDILGRVYIKARHLAILVAHFTVGVAQKTAFFGTYRVELVVTLFSRVVDQYNFDLVLRQLTPLEVACVTCRLGLLNIYNPMKPEGYISLDLSIHEERVVAKIIAALSVTEPGENFINPTFRWEWDFDDVPGWTLLTTWMTEEGMPHRGVMVVEYYSGEGVGLKGCAPNMTFRRSLLNFVRIAEEDIISDEYCHAKQLVGVSCARANETLFKTFLAPPNSTSAQLARGVSIDMIFPLGSGGSWMRRRLKDKEVGNDGAGEREGKSVRRGPKKAGKQKAK